MARRQNCDVPPRRIFSSPLARSSRLLGPRGHLALAYPERVRQARPLRCQEDKVATHNDKGDLQARIEAKAIPAPGKRLRAPREEWIPAARDSVTRDCERVSRSQKRPEEHHRFSRRPHLATVGPKLSKRDLPARERVPKAAVVQLLFPKALKADAYNDRRGHRVSFPSCGNGAAWLCSTPLDACGMVPSLCAKESDGWQSTRTRLS